MVRAWEGVVLDDTRGVTGRDADDRRPADRAGDKLGRYVILDRVGQGGMGVVYAAYDPELDRRVAIKVLRGAADDEYASRDVSRLLREARAIARVSHPNVISVFDVDTAGDVMFIAMEYVQGPTLDRWLKQAPRTVTEVIARYREAGFGLAAAHDTGIVHRDFKPSNVILAGGRCARVLDFGLARAEPSSASAEPPGDTVLDEGPGSQDLLSTPLTRQGIVVGTPFYMAPEQHAGIVANARTDQYSFCVALYLALFGQAPFEADDFGRMVVDKRMGRLRPPPSGASVPRHVTAAVMRGLAADPDHRWPDMRALLDVLGRDTQGLRRRRLGLAATAAAAAFTAGAAVYAGVRWESPCRDADQRLAEVWDDARREAIANGLAGVRVPYAADVLARVQPSLDAYAQQWSATYTDACEATHVRRTQSEDLLDRRMTCLERRRAALRAVVDVLVTADTEVATRAQETVAALPAIDACADTERLLADVEPPAEGLRAEVAGIRDRLADVAALSSAGRFEEALAIGRDARLEATRIDYAPLQAEALLELGYAEREIDRDASEAHLHEALLVATACKHDRIAAEAATELAVVVGALQPRAEEGLRWVALARSLYERLGVNGLELAGLELHEGAVLEHMGELDRARTAYERAIATREAARGADDPMAALWSVNLANVNFQQGRYHEALAVFESVAATTERAWGPTHPNNVVVAVGHGMVLTALGRYDDAEPQFERAQRIGGESLPEDHPWTAGATCNLGLVQERRGDLDAAAETFERCRAGNLRIVGRDHPEYARALENLGRVQRERGRLDDARRLLHEGWELRARLLGADSDETTWAALELADLDRVAGKLEDAERRYVEIVAAFGRDGHDERGLARAQFGLARVRWDLGSAKTDARALAEQARVGLASDVEQARYVAAVDEWLSSHRL